MRDNDRKLADHLAQLDFELGCAIDRRAAALSASEQDKFLGEDSALLRGLLAGLTLCSASDHRR